MSEAQKWIVVAGGILTALAAYLIANGNAASRPIPVTIAAQKLQQAWADHHTYA